MADEKDDPKAAFLRGAKGFLRAAESAALSVKRDLTSRGFAKTIDDGGKEILRAVSNVATTVGNELQDWGRRAQDALDARGDGAHAGAPPADPPAGEPVAHAASTSWPRTREEYEQKYGSVGDDWPKTREDYERRYGHPPPPPRKPKGPTDDDPGFRIA